ncbi:hypothetical protein E2C01_057122 [Portunus trituberculatus]|uniref:Uncharacterized protein n=1 Tax=Portunus trituberculatus TaxID=210409 RepID=A0A5B7GSL4_PORTR|nr:hypothetical protein [Portunus trituberculatus]
MICTLSSQPRRLGFKSQARRGKWVSLLMCSPCSPRSK